jgi:molybdopterin molybdotransferase|tara:strand:- start:41817 stop:43013 length:1197 start_codon:yes stop_codon:yes gene_type:complete
VLSVDEAKKEIFSGARLSVGNEAINLFEALGRRLAEDIYSPVDVPPADNSAMDGITVSFSDCLAGENSFVISQLIAAGDRAESLTPGTAARIFTGAEIPKGADTVEIQENCSFEGDSVQFTGIPELGRNIRSQGQDIKSGALVLAKGSFLRSQELGLIASIGIGQISVFKKLRIGVFSTGDELVEPGTALQPGQIYNSNRYSLAALIQEAGCEFVDLGTAGDSLEQTIKLLRDSSPKVDVLISSGGVSVGDEDHIKPAVEACGSLSLWKIAVKPGKPLAMGKVGNTPFFGLPGNPVSGFATFLLFVKPFLGVLGGGNVAQLQWLQVPADFERKAPSREEYLRVRLSSKEGSNGRAELFPNQSSGVLSSLSWGSGLVRQKIGQAISKGSSLDYLPFSQL